jgi:hypothetical protein
VERSGKTFTAVNVGCRLLKFAGAKRILFLVDRSNLSTQTEQEFNDFAVDTRDLPTLLDGWCSELPKLITAERATGTREAAAVKRPAKPASGPRTAKRGRPRKLQQPA